MKVNKTLFNIEAVVQKTLWLKFVSSYLKFAWLLCNIIRSSFLKSLFMFERVGCFDRSDGYRAEVRHLTDARQSIHVTFPVLHLSEGVLVVGGVVEGLLSIHFRWNTFKDHTLIIRGVLTEFSSLLSWTCP